MRKKKLFKFIKKCFHYLFEEYGFSALEEKQGFGTFRVVYKSEFLNFHIVCDRGDIYINFEINEKEKLWYDLDTIINFILKDSDKKWSYNFFPNTQVYDERIKLQIEYLSNSVKLYSPKIFKFLGKKTENSASEKLKIFEREIIESKKKEWSRKIKSGTFGDANNSLE